MFKYVQEVTEHTTYGAYDATIHFSMTQIIRLVCSPQNTLKQHEYDQKTGYFSLCHTKYDIKTCFQKFLKPKHFLYYLGVSYLTKFHLNQFISPAYSKWY